LSTIFIHAHAYISSSGKRLSSKINSTWKTRSQIPSHPIPGTDLLGAVQAPSSRINWTLQIADFDHVRHVLSSHLEIFIKFSPNGNTGQEEQLLRTVLGRHHSKEQAIAFILAVSQNHHNEQSHHLSRPASSPKSAASDNFITTEAQENISGL
jgi:hypothetical protein